MSNQIGQTTCRVETRNEIPQLSNTASPEVGSNQGLSVTHSDVAPKVSTNQELIPLSIQNQASRKIQALTDKKSFEPQFSSTVLKGIKETCRESDSFKGFDEVFHYRATQKLDKMLEDKIFCVEDFEDATSFMSSNNEPILKKIIDSFIRSEYVDIQDISYEPSRNRFQVVTEITSKETKDVIEQTLVYYEKDINPWEASPHLPIKDKEFFIKTCIINLCKDMGLDVWVSGFEANFCNVANRETMAYIDGFLYWDGTINITIVDKQKAIEFDSDPQNSQYLRDPCDMHIARRIRHGRGKILMPIAELINLENNTANLSALRVRLGERYFEDLFSDKEAPDLMTGFDVPDLRSDSDSVNVRELEEAGGEIGAKKCNEYDMTGYCIV